jgi:thioredoxin reductase (NADPH)
MAFKVDFSSSLAAEPSDKTRVHVAGWTGCGFFQRTKTLVQSLETILPEKYQLVVHESATRDDFIETMNVIRPQFKEPRAHSHTSSPFVCTGNDFKNDPSNCEFIGGNSDTITWTKSLFGGGGASSKPQSFMKPDGYQTPNNYDFDLIVIGGGSGGLAASKEAAKLGARVAVLDYVKPSPQGSQWGLGGTCVNVGCIPKKLMHQSSILGELIKHDASNFGWVKPQSNGNKTNVDVEHDWSVMVNEIQRYIKSLNFGYRVALRDANVKYINGLGEFEGPNAIKVTEFKGKAKTPSSKTLTAARVLIAVGGRPSPLQCPGNELCISSDDLFSLKSNPGKTLLVGAGYVALECAGFLTALGCDATVLCRSMLLRGFDRECCDKIGAYMEHGGTKIKMGLTPKSIVKQNNQLLVTYSDDSVELFDTVVAAVGRTADTAGLNLDAAGITSVARNGKFNAELEQLNVPNIYAIGDVLEGKPELTPVAIQAGILLAQRLFGNKSETMDYANVATAVFTPLEYGAVGLSEEEAIAAKGEDGVEVFHSSFAPLEWSLSADREIEAFPAFAKIICDKTTPDLKVMGLHYLGPNAGEVIQGYAVAVKKGCTYDDIASTVGIHPTTSEQFTTLKITKSSGESAAAAGC